MNQTLSENRQVLIYHNRRGSASITACKNCGWQALCENCFLPMTLHHDKHTLSCHICGKNQKIPSSCPICGEAEIIHKGIGTKIIEEEARRIFPNKKIMRFDADSDKDETFEFFPPFSSNLKSLIFQFYKRKLTSTKTQKADNFAFADFRFPAHKTLNNFDQCQISQTLPLADKFEPQHSCRSRACQLAQQPEKSAENFAR